MHISYGSDFLKRKALVSQDRLKLDSLHTLGIISEGWLNKLVNASFFHRSQWIFTFIGTTASRFGKLDNFWRSRNSSRPLAVPGQ